MFARIPGGRLVLGAAATMATASVVVIVAASGYFSGLAVSRQHQASAVQEAAGVTQPGAGVEIINDWSEQGGRVYAMSWRTDRELWYVASLGEGLVLSRYDVTSGRSTSWPAPAGAAQTPHTFLVADASGRLWIGANYSLALFDPGTEQYVWETTLDANVPGADKGALDPGDPLPGTWINGLMASTDGTVMMTRNHAPFVFSVSALGIKVLRTTARAPAGLRVFDKDPVAYVRDIDTRVPIEGAREARPGLSAELPGCSVKASPTEGLLEVSSDSRKAQVTGLLLHPADVVSGSNGRFAVGLVDEGKLLVLSCQAMSVETFELGSSQEYPDGGLSDGGLSDGGTVLMRHAPEAVAISSGGNVAVSTSVGQVAIVARSR